MFNTKPKVHNKNIRAQNSVIETYSFSIFMYSNSSDIRTNVILGDADKKYSGYLKVL